MLVILWNVLIAEFGAAQMICLRGKYCIYSLPCEWVLWVVLQKKDLGVLVDRNLNVSHQGALQVVMVNHILVMCIMKTIANRCREDYSLLGTCEALSAVLCLVLGPPVLKRFQREALRWLWGWSTDVCGKEAKERFRLEKRKLTGDLTAMFKYVQRFCGKDGAKFFSEMYSERTEGSRPNYQQGKLSLSIRKHFQMKVIKPENQVAWTNSNLRDIKTSPE